MRKELSSRERSVLIRAISGQLRPSISDPDKLQQAAADSRVKLISSTRRVELVLAQATGDLGGCSATGNCPFWVFKRGRDGYLLLLESEAQTFTLLTTKTNGMPDIVLGMHGSAIESDLTEYKFDGKQYQAGRCYSAIWRKLGSDGEYHDSREPRFESCDPSARSY